MIPRAPDPTHDDARQAFAALPSAERAALLFWMLSIWRPAKKRWHCGTYASKHTFGSRGGFYCTNEAFAGAWLASGIRLGEYRAGTWPIYASPIYRNQWRTLHCDRFTPRGWPANVRIVFEALVSVVVSGREVAA